MAQRAHPLFGTLNYPAIEDIREGANGTFPAVWVIAPALNVVVGAADMTAALTTGKYSFDLEATLSNTDVVTIAQGKLEVLKDVR